MRRCRCLSQIFIYKSRFTFNGKTVGLLYLYLKFYFSCGSCIDTQTPLARGVTEAATEAIHKSRNLQQTASLGKLNHAQDKYIADLSENRVSTISGPEFESKRLSQISRSVPDDLPGELDGASQRHLVTFVTPSMETIPLEMLDQTVYPPLLSISLFEDVFALRPYAY